MDLSQLMQQAQQMQARLQEAQDALADQTVTGTGGGGVVTVEADGKGAVRKVTIDPKVVDPSDVAMLEDLVTVAVADAQRKAQALQEAAIGDATGGLAGGMGLPFGM
jgi:DNA-binding YbaB/EbfC family protein